MWTYNVIKQFKTKFLEEKILNIELEIKNSKLTENGLRILIIWAYEVYKEQKNRHKDEIQKLKEQINNLSNQQSMIQYDQTLQYYKDQIGILQQKWGESVEDNVKQKKIINDLCNDKSNLTSRLERCLQDQQQEINNKESLKSQLEDQLRSEIHKLNQIKEEIIKKMNYILLETEQIQIQQYDCEDDINYHEKYSNFMDLINEMIVQITKINQQIENYLSLIKSRINDQDFYLIDMINKLEKYLDCFKNLKVLFARIRDNFQELISKSLNLQNVNKKFQNGIDQDKAQLTKDKTELQNQIYQLTDQIIVERKESLQILEKLREIYFSNDNSNIKVNSQQEEKDLYKQFIINILKQLNLLVNKKLQQIINEKHNTSEEIDVINKIKAFMSQQMQPNDINDDMIQEEKKCKDLFRIFYSSLGKIKYRQNIFQIVYQAQINMKQTLRLKGLLLNEVVM